MVSSCEVTGVRLHLSCCAELKLCIYGFCSRVQPEASPSRNSVPKIFADIFQNVGSTPDKVLSITQKQSFWLVLRWVLNSMAWRRIQDELSLGADSE